MPTVPQDDFDIRALPTPVWVEANVIAGARDSEEEQVRGYAIAVGWFRQGAGGGRRIQGRQVPELQYLVSDPRRQRPIWVAEGSIVRHFRSNLSEIASAAEPQATAPD